ncbi:MAG: hypothetical protein HGB03_01560 [Candidatus Yonathbacteria bacterium]|nr:hypothetical protein [Candidatus Yonathbacteria bacterium]NTW47951.1 hypothetical protein [Candidatus Yonathbacteria bacterium]
MQKKTFLRSAIVGLAIVFGVSFNAPAYAGGNSGPSCPQPTPHVSIDTGIMGLSSVGIEGAIGTMGTNINMVSAGANNCVHGRVDVTPVSVDICTSALGNAFVSDYKAAGASFGGGIIVAALSSNLDDILDDIGELGN